MDEVQAHDDEEAQMAAMMGFSSFSAPAKPEHICKKRKTAAADADAAVTQVGERPEIGSGASQGNSNYLPLGQRRDRALPASTALHATNNVSQDPAAGYELPGGASVKQHTEAEGNSGHDKLSAAAAEAAAAHPALSKSLDQLDGSDYHALRRGVPDGSGRLVYFQPSFIVDDPWATMNGGQVAS